MELSTVELITWAAYFEIKRNSNNGYATATYKIVLQDRTKRAFKAIGRSLNSIRKSIFSMKTAFISAAGIAGIGFFVKKSRLHHGRDMGPV